MKRKRLCLAGYTLVAAASLGCSRTPGLNSPTASVVETAPSVQHTVAEAWEADRSGDSERALAMYLDVLSADPHNAWAKRRVEQLSVNLPAGGEKVATAEGGPKAPSNEPVQQVAATETIAAESEAKQVKASANPFEDWAVESERRDSLEQKAESKIADTDSPADSSGDISEVFPWAEAQPAAAAVAKTDTPDTPSSSATVEFNDEAVFDSIAQGADPFTDGIEFSDTDEREALEQTDLKEFNPFEALADAGAESTESSAIFSQTVEERDKGERRTIETVSFSQSELTDFQPKKTTKRLVDLCNDANAEILSLVGKLDSPVASTRRAGLQGLGLLGEKAQTAKLPVRIMFGDDDAVVSAEAAWTLWQIDGESFESVRHLASLIKSKDAAAADAAVQCLGLIGGDAIAAAPQLRNQLNRLAGVRRVRVAEALVRIQPEDVGALQVLIESTRYGRSVERTEATYALAHTPTVHIETITPVLVNALHDENEAVRTAAALTLGSFGPKAEHARLALESAAEYDYPHVRDAARAALDCLPK